MTEPSLFQKVLAADKNNIKAWNGVGVTYQLMGDNNAAIKCFTKILNIDSREIQAWISIGFVYQKMMKFNDALKCYKKAQMIIGNRYHHKLYDGLASCLTKLSEFDQAIEVYQQIFQREEGKKKWDAQRSMKFVNKLKRKKLSEHCKVWFRRRKRLPERRLQRLRLLTAVLTLQFYS